LLNRKVRCEFGAVRHSDEDFTADASGETQEGLVKDNLSQENCLYHRLDLRTTGSDLRPGIACDFTPRSGSAGGLAGRHAVARNWGFCVICSRLFGKDGSFACA